MKTAVSKVDVLNRIHYQPIRQWSLSSPSPKRVKHLQNGSLQDFWGGAAKAPLGGRLLKHSLFLLIKTFGERIHVLLHVKDTVCRSRFLYESAHGLLCTCTLMHLSICRCLKGAKDFIPLMQGFSTDDEPGTTTRDGTIYDIIAYRDNRWP